MKSLLLILLLAVISVPAIAQNESQDYLRMQEQMRKAELLRQLDSGVQYMDFGKHELANQKFLYVLNNSRSVPSDLTFYFGKNSFYLDKFKQTIDWLNKYIQLKGTNGQFSEEALSLLKLAEAEFLKQKLVETKKAEIISSNRYDIDCGPSGKVICPVCKGEHVTIKKTPFGDEYKTCLYCSEHGVLTCEEYNKLLRGELKQKL